MNTDADRNNNDLRELLEKLIEGRADFDDRIRKQLGRARESCLLRPLDPRVSEFYGLCLDTLDKMQESGLVVGFELDVMRGTVLMCQGMHLAAKGNSLDAGQYYKMSQESFKKGSCPEGEVLAYIGLARSYSDRNLLTLAREVYEKALIKLDSLPSADFALRQLKKRVEDKLDEIERKLVEQASPLDISPPPGITSHSRPIPVVGDIKAGYPGLLSGEDNIDDWVIVDDRLVGDAEFSLRVKEDSMIGAGILPGDSVFIRPQTADIRSREIAAVHIATTDGQHEGTLKHVEWKGTHWYLASENSGVRARVVAPTNAEVQRIATEYKARGEDVEPVEGTVEIVGKVVAVMRSLP